MARPNFVFVFSDQQHWQACGFEDPFFQTPNLDRFAAEGVVFSQSFCTTPQCSPSRSSILTGLYPSKTGVLNNLGHPGGPPLPLPTVGAMLRSGGHHTAYFGKWHLGKDPTGTAGWDEDFGVTGKDTTDDEAVTRQAVEFLARRRRGDKPFALFLSYNDPHGVYRFRSRDEQAQAPAEGVPLPDSWHHETLDGKPHVQKQFMTDDQGRTIYGKERPDWEIYHDLYRQRVALYDRHLGAVLGALADAGAWDQTIVIVTSDHGDMDTHHRLIFKGPFMYEQMIRVPLIVRVPEAFGGGGPGRVEEDVVNVDLVPTMLDFAGLEPIECDGASLRPPLTGRGLAPRREFVIGQYYGKQKWVNPIRMIRTRGFKYNVYIDHGEELYDLAADPHELTNLAGDAACAEVQASLRARLDRWIRDNDDPFYTYRTTTRDGQPLGAG